HGGDTDRLPGVVAHVFVGRLGGELRLFEQDLLGVGELHLGGGERSLEAVARSSSSASATTTFRSATSFSLETSLLAERAFISALPDGTWGTGRLPVFTLAGNDEKVTWRVNFHGAGKMAPRWRSPTTPQRSKAEKSGCYCCWGLLRGCLWRSP